MKEVLFIVLSTLYSGMPLSGQCKDSIYNKESLTSQPKFKGDLSDYIISNVDGGLEAQEYGGTVIVKFVVDQMGKVQNVTAVLNDASKSLRAEGIRLIKKTSGQWEPGKIHGKPVCCQSEIAFILDPDDEGNDEDYGPPVKDSLYTFQPPLSRLYVLREEIPGVQCQIDSFRVSFVVTPSGSTTDWKLTGDSINSLQCKAFLMFYVGRVSTEHKQWTIATIRGRPVRYVQYSTVIFKDIKD